MSPKAIFAFVHAALIKPLPYQNPSRLLFVTGTTPELPRAAVSYPDYFDWKKHNRVFDSLEVYHRIHGGRASRRKLCVSVVDRSLHHRDTEDTEIAQRRSS